MSPLESTRSQFQIPPLRRILALSMFALSGEITRLPEMGAQYVHIVITKVINHSRMVKDAWTVQGHRGSWGCVLPPIAA